MTIEEIGAGLDNSEFYLEYVPTMTLEDGKCVGAEALIRWRHQGEVILPMQFIPAIENTPLSGLITYWVIEEIARDFVGWLKAHKDVHLSINIPPEILGRGGLLYVARKSGLMEVADQMILEITERGCPDTVALNSMRHKGHTRIAIDDFGTGDVNLLQLSQMRADILKIDKYFVDQIQSPKLMPRIIKGLTAFALAMDLEMIAEGVESGLQVKALSDLGVHMAQGWYFSRSLIASEFIKFHAAHS